MNSEYWNKDYYEKNYYKLDDITQIWVKDYEYLLKNKGKVLDLGCGMGEFTKYFLNNGYETISIDISEKALSILNSNIDNATTICLDMSKGLPFDNCSFDIVFSNLSLHFFDDSTTSFIISEIHRILKNNGLIIGSVNTEESIKKLKKDVIKIEDNYYINNGICQRIWTNKQFEYFNKFTVVLKKKKKIVRWGKENMNYIFIFRK